MSAVEKEVEIGREVKKSTVVSTAILRDMDGKILLLLRSNSNRTYRGYWQFPEGKLKFGEKPEDALKREVFEETGLRVTSHQLNNVQSFVFFQAGVGVCTVRMVFDVEWKGLIRLSSEHSRYEWLAIKDALGLEKLFVGMEQALKMLAGSCDVRDNGKIAVDQ